MRVLVTGHHGYIGPAVVAALRAEHHELVGLDCDLFRGCALEADTEIPSVRRDIRDVTGEELRGFDAIVHLAGLSNDPLGAIDPALTYEINARATVRLARNARIAGVKRFLFSSSCSVYGASTEPWVDETSSPNPVTPYAASKLEAERGLAELTDGAFCVASLRNATAFGYSPNLRTDLVVNDLVAGAFLWGEIRLNSDGSAWRPLVHIRDIAQAFARALAAPPEAINGRVINVGSNEQNYRVIEIAQTIAGLVPGARLQVAANADADKRSYRVRFDEVSRLLPSFRCQYDLAAGVAEIISHFRRIHFATTEGCVRLAYLRRLIEAGDVDGGLRRATETVAAL